MSGAREPGPADWAPGTTPPRGAKRVRLASCLVKNASGEKKAAQKAVRPPRRILNFSLILCRNNKLNIPTDFDFLEISATREDARSFLNIQRVSELFGRYPGAPC
jgi:hypothetical protein